MNIDRVGEVNYNKQGEKMTIIAYRGCNDIDIQFEDGTIVYNRQYGNFKHGSIKKRNMLAYIYPNIARMIAIEENNLTFEDCYKIPYKSNKKFYFKCDKCGVISNKRLILNSIVTRGYYSCEKCSDNISIPNKFAYNLLNQININFKSEYSPYYFRNTQKVDFLLIDYNIILEMDGCFKNRHTREYDYWRDFLNMKYGGYKTIRIKLTNDYRYNNDKFNYIKEQIINSELSNIFDLSNIDWELIWYKCQKSKCFEAWELWNSGNHDTKEISKILNLSQDTIVTYLKRGVDCNKCDYSVEKSKENGFYKMKGRVCYSKKVICITTGKIFNTVKDGAKFYNMKNGAHIGSCCRGKRKSAGKLEDGTKLIWRYYEESDYNE